MKICLVAHFKTNPVKGDIGTISVGLRFAEELSKHHEIMKVDIKDINSWRNIKTFKPQLIHFILAPTTMGFITAKIISLYCKGVKTIMSAPNPSFSFKRLIPLLKPDLILPQSQESEQTFKNLGIRTEFLPNGVDIARFVPVPQNIKQKLRQKYKVDVEKFVILHVGPIIKGRNIQLLKQLQNDDNQVAIIGRLQPLDKTIYQDLEQNGCLVWINHFERIEEIYMLSDCYVFPTPPAHRLASIELPLSVMEAMSCNLPVISTRFGALPRLFEQGDGLFFADKEEGFFQGLKAIKAGVEVRTRQKVMPYSWENVIGRLEEIYSRVLNS